MLVGTNIGRLETGIVVPGSHYTDSQRREAAAQYVMLGNLAKVAEATGIPQRTLGDWVRTDWFRSIVAEVRAEKAIEIDASYTRIIHKTLDQLIDRLDNGDPCMINGKVGRRPVSARDLAMIAGIIWDKRALARQSMPDPMPRVSPEELMRSMARYAAPGAPGNGVGEGKLRDED